MSQSSPGPAGTGTGAFLAVCGHTHLFPGGTGEGV